MQVSENCFPFSPIATARWLGGQRRYIGLLANLEWRVCYTQLPSWIRKLMSENSDGNSNGNSREISQLNKRTKCTIAGSLGSGVTFTGLLFLPQQWCPGWASVVGASREQLLTYTAANMILATFILTLPQEKDPVKTICTLVTGVYVLVVAYMLIKIDCHIAKLIVVIVGMLPTAIAIVGMDPYLRKHKE